MAGACAFPVRTCTASIRKVALGLRMSLSLRCSRTTTYLYGHFGTSLALPKGRKPNGFKQSGRSKKGGAGTSARLRKLRGRSTTHLPERPVERQAVLALRPQHITARVGRVPTLPAHPHPRKGNRLVRKSLPQSSRVCRVLRDLAFRSAWERR